MSGVVAVAGAAGVGKSVLTRHCLAGAVAQGFVELHGTPAPTRATCRSRRSSRRCGRSCAAVTASCSPASIVGRVGEPAAPTVPTLSAAAS
ncbi:hypothetical protein ACQEVB_10665 [Pseudonocardia sp. CA-107938]|uniref:hypothetical protein n=1 Tax=Pseudonocardia sp. CA-107938 TaxID=3240021 RepID=UPI003D8A2A05